MDRVNPDAPSTDLRNLRDTRVQVRMYSFCGVCLMNQKEAFLRRKDHPNNPKDDFRTPDYLMNYLKNLFGDRIRDGACSIENAKGEPIDVFNPEIAEHEWVFINPPFDTPTIIDFVQASLEISTSNVVVFLLPNKLCQKSFVYYETVL